MIVGLDTCYGKMFVPDTDAGQYWWLANTGASPEDMFIEELLALLDERPKGTAVDVGANFGCWTLPLARHAHKVFAIEPQRGCRALLSRSIATSGLTNVTVVEHAASDVPGTAQIPDLSMDHGSNFGGVSLNLAFADEPDARMVEVRTIRLNDLLAGEPVSFIKIDVEGHEAKVIAGARKVIARCRPILFVEMDHIMTDAQALRQSIESMGYVIDKRGGNFLGLPL